jgi:hypothetical protein
MNGLFLDEIEPRDQTYCFIRDHPDGAEAKVFVWMGASIDYSYRDKIEKKSGRAVSTDVFLDPTHDVISAALFCPSNVWCRPPSDAEVGLDFMLIHNPRAKHKIPYQWLKCGRECWVEEDHLVIKNWHKEHPPYVKETEPAFTLEDAIRKNNAQRRVTREMLDQWRKDGA